MFIDEVRILVKAGDGGNGCLAFRREKFVSKGGPSGGDGGNGGDVTLVANQHYNTLLHFRFNPEHKAERGRHGEGSNRTGREGKSIEVPVPVGTIVYDYESGEVIHDFTVHGDKFVIAKGGRGGRGNQHFAKPWHQAPTEHEPGKPGEEHVLRLELKLLADVGLVGFPNAGKSTLISRISAARPKIADYPFTTLEPNSALFRVTTIGLSWLLIFPVDRGRERRRWAWDPVLKHVERTRLLVHLVDTSELTGRKPAEDFKIVMTELENFSPELAAKPMILVASKIDVAQDTKRISSLKQLAKRKKLEFFEISAVTGKGINELKRAMAEHVLAPLPASIE
jgi:GTP-binding protein